MSLGPAKTAIRSYIEAGFTAAPINWENEPYQLPGVPAAFVRVEIAGVTNELQTTGEPANNMFTHSGVIFVYCFTEAGIGFAAGDALADALGLLLQRKQIAAPASPQVVRTRDPSIRSGVTDGEIGNYYRTDVVVPFDFHYFG